ncbi:MAG: hypothetical protein KDE27_00660 [Planctomycetes bacterium]|nr:hypothetical protein [Planctomycetota bacterium]
MRSLPGILLPVLALLSAGCGNSAADGNDVILTFAVTGTGTGEAATAISAETTVHLAAKKPQRTTIVDAWQDDAGEGAQYGRHKFPAGTTAPAIAGYFDGLLKNAGWTDADYRVQGVTLSLFGVSDVMCGADRSEVAVTMLPAPR